MSAKELQINEAIRAREVRIVGEGIDGRDEQLGIMNISDAQKHAFDKGLDLVLIAPQATPPVCRIMDYGKFRYERDKRDKEAKKKQTIVEVKEVQLSIRIETHDFNTKVNNAIRFLSAGNKVRVILRFRGREMAHQDLGRETLKKFEDACLEYGVVDKKPTFEGRMMTMFISPLKPVTKSDTQKDSKDTTNTSDDTDNKENN